MNIIKFKNGIYNSETNEFIPDKPELDIANQLLYFLSLKRVSDKKECINIGSILCNIGKGSYQALGMWIDFVFSIKKSNVVFTELECIKYWSAFNIRDSNWLETLYILVETDTKDLLYEDFLKYYESSSVEEIEPREEVKEIEIKEKPKEMGEVEEILKEEPEPVKELTILEIFNLFVDECIKTNERGMLNFTDFSEVLVPWIEENFPNKKTPKIQNIKAFFYNNSRSISGGINIMMWKGFDIKNEYERYQARQARISSQSEKQI